MARSRSGSWSSRYLLSQADASIVVGTVTVILLKTFVWKLLLEVDAVTVASGGSPSGHLLVHHFLGLNCTDRWRRRVWRISSWSGFKSSWSLSSAQRVCLIQPSGVALQ